MARPTRPWAWCADVAASDFSFARTASVDLQAFMAAWRARVRPPGAIRVTIDIDPYSFL